MSARITLSPVRRIQPSTNGSHKKPTHGESARFERLPVIDIINSPTNPRKYFDPDKLKELAASIKSKGVLQPVLVRPHPKKSGRYELVAGERRWHATKIAGLIKIPATICDYTDDEVIEIQVIENDQREDVTPLERARGYQQMIERGRSVEEIATKTSRSASTIRSILRLLRLPPLLAEAVEQGMVAASVAELVCRMPNEETRNLLAACVLMGTSDLGYANYRLKGFKKLPTNCDPLSYQKTRELIDTAFTVELKGAPFNTDDAALEKKAGSCEKCPKRVGNNREDFPEGRADVCTDPACYRRKCELYELKLVDEARRGGLEVIPAAEARRMFSEHGGVAMSKDYLDLDDCLFGPVARGRSYRQLLKAEIDAKTIKVFVAFDWSDERHELVRRADAEGALRKSGILEAVAPSNEPASKTIDHAVQNKLRQLARQTAADPNFGGRDQSTKALLAAAITSVERFEDSLRHDELELLLEGRVSRGDVPQGKAARGGRSEICVALLTWCGKAQVSQLLGLLLEASILDASTFQLAGVKYHDSIFAALKVPNAKSFRESVMKEMKTGGTKK